MKRASYIKLLTLAAIVAITLLQGLWTVNVYGLLQKKLSEQINDVFTISINKDLMNRRNAIVDSTTNEIVGVVEVSDEKGVFSGPELIYQEFLIKKNQPIQLRMLDSIFHSEISKHNIYGDFIINRINLQTGEVLETTDSLGKGKLANAMASEIIPIRLDGSEGVQVLLVSPYRAVFRKMIFILVLSQLLVLFVGYVVFFLLRSFITEKRLRKFQADFSHALVHNMATPLGTIMQINNLMTKDTFVADTEKRNKSLKVSQQQILNLQALTDRILTVARSEQSKLAPHFEPINISEEVKNIVDTYSLQGKKEIVFSTHFQPEAITFSADRTMFGNIMDNLIDNAIKYSGTSVRINIECLLSEDGLIISIKDNGYGVSDKDKRIIFAKFQCGEAIKRGEAKGFGLGLAYVKSVAEAHGGTINLFSQKGEGTTFELFLPYRDKITAFPLKTGNGEEKN
ncbi:MAG: HAMP domain-containing sensor histidine kinase [Bacteroidia bacterium]|nr:HAMP domain-containing sensor histidine kinase [Bacteroidia bacterium]